MRRAYGRSLNESDFPFTVEEVLEQIEDIRKLAIRDYETRTKLFKISAIEGGSTGDIEDPYSIAEKALSILILNYAYKNFEKLNDEPDPEIFEEKLDEVRDDILDMHDPRDQISRLAFNNLKKKLPFFKYL